MAKLIFEFEILYIAIGIQRKGIFSFYKIGKEGNVLFNDALDTFYLVVWHQVYGSKGSPRQLERKTAAATTRATLFDQQQEIFYVHNPTAFVIPVVDQ